MTVILAIFRLFVQIGFCAALVAFFGIIGFIVGRGDPGIVDREFHWILIAISLGLILLFGAAATLIAILDAIKRQAPDAYELTDRES